MLTRIFQNLRLQNPKKNVFKDARINKPFPPPPLKKVKHIKEISFFMHKHIERIVNVEGDKNCGFRAVISICLSSSYMRDDDA